MGDYLLCAAPARGHVAPMLTIAGHLTGEGHRVRMLAGRLFEAEVQRAGAEFVPLPPECDFDERDLDAVFPGRAEHHGMDRLRFDIDHYFLDAMRPQFRAIRGLVDRSWPDAIVADLGVTGTLPLLLSDGPRPPVVTIGITPFQFSSRDTAPFGPGLKPWRGPAGRARNHLLQSLMQRVFAANQRHANDVLAAEGARPMPAFLFDGALLGDLYLQLCSPGFEYPRSDLPGHVRFVGPLIPTVRVANQERALPPWWESEDRRPVVLVTQGTVDNLDLSRLVVPSLAALADLDVRVIAALGPRPPDAVPIRLPANAWATDYVPFAEILPRVDVMITNGGYGGVNQALAHGVPLIVAGDTEDKPEVAARVAWVGAGIRLRTGDPRPHAVRRAVRRVLADDRYRRNAGRLRDEIAGMHALDAITQSLATVRVRGHDPAARVTT